MCAALQILGEENLLHDSPELELPSLIVVKRDFPYAGVQ